MTLGAPYRKLWTAAAISNIGDGISLVAVPLLATRLTRDPVLIAGVAVAQRLPWLFFSLIAGALVDRLDRRSLMGVVDLARAGLMVLLGMAVFSDWASIGLLYVVVFAMGVAETLFDNASQAIMPSLVRHDQLESANARLYGVQIVANSFIGPPIGGVLFATAAAVPFFIDGASFFGAALLALAIGGRYRPPMPDGPPQTIRQDIMEGLRWLWQSRVVRGMAIGLGIFGFANQGAYALIVLYSLEILHLTEAEFGLLFGVTAGGAVLGSVVASRIARALGRGPTLVACALVSAASLAVIGAASSVWIVGPLLTLDGMVSVVWNVITVSLRQSLIPDRLLGRVNSVYRLIGWGSWPVGAFLGGLVAKSLGLRAPFFIASAIIVAMALLLLVPLAPRMKEAAEQTD